MTKKTKEEQQQRKLNLEDFDLIKFKIADTGGDVAYYDKSNPKLGKQTAEVKDKLHEDLLTAIENLKPIMARRVGLLEVTDHLITNFQKNKKVLEYALETEKAQVERCKVSGITYSGENQLRRVQITGSIKVPTYGSYGMACPGITLSSEQLGYEAEAIELFERVRVEVYNHVFNGKRAPKPEDNQTSILDDDQTEGGE